MTAIPNLTWEKSLLSLADAADSPARQGILLPAVDRKLLIAAYKECEEITEAHSRSFYLATMLLPTYKKAAMQALYAFCRCSDDIVDRQSETRAEHLRRWRADALSARPPTDNPVILAMADARQRFGIPIRYIEQLIDGVGRDLHQNRYETFEELAAYAYGVASTVGLMSMQITGYWGPQAIPYAIKLGVALQMTNILRDVSEDWQVGRIYLPANELSAFGLDESDIASGHVHDRWRRFMQFQIKRNRRLYAEAWPGIKMLNKDGRLAVAAAASFYRSILDDIEAHDFDVFGRRAHVKGWKKLVMIPGLWWHNC